MPASIDRPSQDRAEGIVLRFGYPAKNSVEVDYTRFDLFSSGWKEGFQQRRLALAFNDQCFADDVVMELKRAAEALGIKWGDSPTLTVIQPDAAPAVHNWRHLSELAAKRLGWVLIHPFGAPVEAPPLELSDDS